MYLHGAVGLALVLISFFGITETAGRVGSDRMRFALPVATAVGGLMVLFYVGAHHLRHGGGESEYVDTAHWVIGGTIAFSGIVVGHGRIRLPWRLPHELALPFAIIVVGAIFLVHGGGAGTELMLHIAITATLVLSSVAHFSVVLSGEDNRALRLFAALLLAIGGMLLVFYDAHAPLTSNATQDAHPEH